jgi:hypothetical protein
LRERKILKYLLVGGLISIPFIFRKQPIKDWILVFCLKAFYSGYIDSFMVAKNKISYPVRYFPKIFNINVLFDLLLFPISCVIYNQLTYRSNFVKSLYMALPITIPMTIAEIWAEKNTKLLTYKKKWNWFYSFITLTFSLWLVRGTMAIIRKVDKTSTDWAAAEK